MSGYLNNIRQFSILDRVREVRFSLSHSAEYLGAATNSNRGAPCFGFVVENVYRFQHVASCEEVKISM